MGILTVSLGEEFGSLWGEGLLAASTNEFFLDYSFIHLAHIPFVFFKGYLIYRLGVEGLRLCCSDLILVLLLNSLDYKKLI